MNQGVLTYDPAIWSVSTGGLQTQNPPKLGCQWKGHNVCLYAGIAVAALAAYYFWHRHHSHKGSR